MSAFIADHAPTADFVGQALPQSGALGRYAGGDGLEIVPSFYQTRLACPGDTVSDAFMDRVWADAAPAHARASALAEMYGVAVGALGGAREYTWHVHVQVSPPPSVLDYCNWIAHGFLYSTGTAACNEYGALPSRFPLVGAYDGVGISGAQGNDNDPAALGMNALAPAQHDLHDFCCLTAQVRRPAKPRRSRSPPPHP